MTLRQSKRFASAFLISVRSRAKSSQQALRRRFVRHEVVIGTGLLVALGDQTAPGQCRDRASMTLIEQAQDHVHGGQAGADDRHGSFRRNVDQLWFVPRIRDVARTIELPDRLTREDSEADCRCTGQPGRTLPERRPGS